MKFMVRIPHGSFVVEVQNKSAWLAIQWGFYMRSVPFQVKKYRRPAKSHRVISESDLLIIGATDPNNKPKMAEVRGLLGVGP